MFKKIVTIMTMLFAASSANAGIFGGPSEEDLAKRHVEQQNCTNTNSWAYCVLVAGGNLRTLRDVEVPNEVYADITKKGQLIQASTGVAGIAVGVSQLAGSFPTVISRSGMGTMNVLGGIFALTKSNTEGLGDKMIAFLPMHEAPDGVAAHQKIEQAYVDAFVKSVPGITSAAIETIRLDDGQFATTYVLKGGECDQKLCVLWSEAWGRRCKAEPCERNKVAARLIENGFIGEGKFWVPIVGSHVVILESPKSGKQLWHAIREPFNAIGGFNNKLELMQTVSSHLPAWASYFLFQNQERGVPYPVVLNGGHHYLLIKPKKEGA